MNKNTLKDVNIPYYNDFFMNKDESFYQYLSSRRLLFSFKTKYKFVDFCKESLKENRKKVKNQSSTKSAKHCEFIYTLKLYRF